MHDELDLVVESLGNCRRETMVSEESQNPIEVFPHGPCESAQWLSP